MKVYIVKDINDQWRVQIDKPVWKNRSYGFEMTTGSTGICTFVVRQILRELGYDSRKFKQGEYLETDLT